jgi:CRP/FNR family cyclic AMP-dependent transcriptional regulator
MGPTPIADETISKRTAFLQKVPLFRNLGDEDLEVLARNFHPRKYKRKEVIFHQGDDSRVLYLVMKGKVRIFSLSPAGNETSIRVFAAHDMIGEFAAIDAQPRSTTAQAMEDCTLLEMDQSKFMHSIREMPELAIGLIKQLVEKLRWTTNYAETIAQYDTAGRLLHIILHYNEMMGKAIEAGKRYELNLSMNQADLASLVGARREWVNRILRDWSKRGLIEYVHGKITILDLPAVEEERDRRVELYADDEGW